MVANCVKSICKIVPNCVQSLQRTVRSLECVACSASAQYVQCAVPSMYIQCAVPSMYSMQCPVCTVCSAQYVECVAQTRKNWQERPNNSFPLLPSMLDCPSLISPHYRFWQSISICFLVDQSWHYWSVLISTPFSSKTLVKPLLPVGLLHVGLAICLIIPRLFDGRSQCI